MTLWDYARNLEIKLDNECKTYLIKQNTYHICFVFNEIEIAEFFLYTLNSFGGFWTQNIQQQKSKYIVLTKFIKGTNLKANKAFILFFLNLFLRQKWSWFVKKNVFTSELMVRKKNI